MGGIISTHLAVSFNSGQREVTSYKMTSFRTFLEAEIYSFAD